MILTNKYNLPVALVNAMTKDSYTKGAAEYSVTGLLQPPKVALLQKIHSYEMSQDVSEKAYTFLGTALHKVLEDTVAPEGHTFEERLFAELDGVTISGAIDIQEDTPMGVTIWDYKTTSVWAVMNEKMDWTWQLNMYKWFVEKAKGKKVGALKICAFLRDWSKNGKGENYPSASIVVIDLPMWSFDEIEAFMRERLNAHVLAKNLAVMGEEFIPPCSNEERWMSETTYAVKREGRKTAIRVLTTEKEATELAEKENGYVEIRSGEPRRCAGNYCGVAQWCKQYQPTEGAFNEL
jgi:hypothetical protein